MQKSTLFGHLSTRSAKTGAATVSAVWLIVVGVLFLVGLFYGYTENESATKAKADTVKARLATVALQEKLDATDTIIAGLTSKLGFNDQSIIGSTSDITQAESGLETLRNAYPFVGTTVVTYQDTIQSMITSYNEKLAEIQTLLGQVQTEKGRATAAEDALRDVTRTKDAEIRVVQQQLSDLQNSSSDQQNTLEGRVAQAVTNRDQKDSEARTARGVIDDRDREIISQADEHETRTKAMSRVLKFLREPEAPDGEILAASESLPLGWINLGGRDRVHRGMEFRVVSGRAGTAPDKVKAFAIVTKVEEKRCEVEFYELADRFDPVVKGDIIYNPLYHPGPRNAVLIGRFTGTYSEKELRILLEEIGITVQPRLDAETDYLLVGQEVYVDEDGEHLEEPILPSDMPLYKEAESMGVRVITLSDVTRYFKK